MTELLLALYVVAGVVSATFVLRRKLRWHREQNAQRVAMGRRELPFSRLFVTELIFWCGILWPIAWAMFAWDMVDE